MELEPELKLPVDSLIKPTEDSTREDILPRLMVAIPATIPQILAAEDNGVMVGLLGAGFMLNLKHQVRKERIKVCWNYVLISIYDSNTNLGAGGSLIKVLINRDTFISFNATPTHLFTTGECVLCWAFMG